MTRRTSSGCAKDVKPKESFANLTNSVSKIKMKKLVVKFPTEVWNDYTSAQQPPSLEKASLDGSVSMGHYRNTDDQKRNLPNRTRCKAKLCRFQFGGPGRHSKGKLMNVITLEQPCLEPTCPTCRLHHFTMLS